MILGKESWSCSMFALRVAVVVISITVVACGDSFPASRNELSALKTLKLSCDMETLYKSTQGRFGSLEEISRSSPALSSNLRDLSASGYKLEIEATKEKLVVKAWPQEYGRTGRRSFYC